jgi:hypothetical protein
MMVMNALRNVPFTYKVEYDCILKSSFQSPLISSTVILHPRTSKMEKIDNPLLLGTIHMRIKSIGMKYERLL